MYDAQLPDLQVATTFPPTPQLQQQNNNKQTNQLRPSSQQQQLEQQQQQQQLQGKSPILNKGVVASDEYVDYEHDGYVSPRNNHNLTVNTINTNNRININNPNTQKQQQRNNNNNNYYYDGSADLMSIPTSNEQPTYNIYNTNLNTNNNVVIDINGTPRYINNRPLATRSPYINNAKVLHEDDTVYDDMTGRRTNSNLQDQNLSFHDTFQLRLLHLSQNISSWMFRKPPQLIPGTIFYQLTMWWFKFVLYYQPLTQQILGIICGLFSLTLLWCELTIMMPYNLSPISYLAHIDGASISVQTIVRILPLPYIIACTYYTVYHINLGWWFHMQTAHRTSIRSMLFSCSFMLRTIFTTTYNYYQMCRIEDTAFTDFVGPSQ
eukprot:UN02079